ncbi:MAG: SPOR domain-containing protein [Methylovulum sp.]|nr:SPOR domain-containing protein [Methylovulum sp.]
MKKSIHDSINTVDHFLITQERKQKLELLIHLVSNLTQALVICGPQGIGKTTLLRVLHEHNIASWLYCPVQGHADLSFEAISEQVNLAVRQGNQGKNKNIVLLIDDAGALMPGLITTIIQYAWTNPLIRVVFVLTPDELHVKSSTDQVIDDCHFVEIPPLSEKQCGDFLQQLSTKPWARLSLNAINDTMIRNVYRHTHGIPGRIIEQIPSLAKAKKGINSLWVLLAAVAGLVAVALGMQWYSSTKNHQIETVTPVAVEQQPVISPKALPYATKTPVIKQQEKPVQASELILDQYIAKAVNNADVPKITVITQNKPDTPVSASNHNQAIATDAESPSVVSPSLDVQPTESNAAPTASTEAQSEIVDWLKTQPPGNYTLQVMLLSKEQSIKELMKKYPLLAPDLRYIKTLIGGKEKFLLLYGSFSNSVSALKAKQTLPREFSHSIVKKISAIKK